MERLTPVQANVVEALRRRADRGEPAPTYRDLCAEFGWASTGTARDHLRALVRKGVVELAAGHRRLRLLEERAAVTHVPLVGRVVAGVPVISDENVETRIPVPADWTEAGSYFALRVVGESMEGAGIHDGDQVVVRQQGSARDGDIVVATLDGETTLKRLRIRGRRVTLVAENRRFRPIDVRTESAVVQGVVVGLLRKYPGGARAGHRAARSCAARASRMPARKGTAC